MAPINYIIVGSGVFGASTALYLIRKYPQARICLIDRNAFNAPTRVAASWDWNKVVRADYNDIVYTKMALEARDLWKGDPLWNPFYHESGIYWISATGFAKQVLENFDKLGVKAELFSYPVEEARGLYTGIFKDADYTGIKEVLVNKTSGWADAKDVLQKVIETAVELGVEYIEAEVTSLDFEAGNGNCKGVITQTGETVVAERTILCTGAFTAKLLADSAPERTTLHAGDRIVAAAVAEAIAPLNSEQIKTFSSMPVAIQEVPAEKGGSNGCLPPNRDGALKFWGQWIFRNTVYHPATGSEISMPPSGTDYDQWKVPKSLEDDVRFANKVIFGKKGQELELEKFRICWEAITPSEDFIISPHTSCGNLYIATCGSFHGWKFFPVLGKYVLEMLDGSLDPALVKKWSWDRELPSTDDNAFWPRRELKDLWGL